jgi:hypothetical protein
VSSDLFSENGAVLSPCRTWRYRLWRKWREESQVNFLMLNPSTADESADDPTIRRCLGYARRWGYGGIVVTNLFALRATDPGALREHPDPVGPHNDQAILAAACSCALVVCAWGSHGDIRGRAGEVEWLLRRQRIRPHYLRRNQDGHPAHPLYLKGDIRPVPWSEWPAAALAQSAPPRGEEPAP